MGVADLNTSLGILPFMATVLWAAVFYFNSTGQVRSWRWSLALSCTFLGAFTLFLTESLSATHLLHFVPTLIAWSALLTASLICLWQQWGSISFAAEAGRLRGKLALLPPWITFAIAIILSHIILMAVATPPMNFDVQIYHLPREIFWMMHGSVDPFDASNSHQVSMPVLSEFLGLNLLLLTGGDAWHNLVQPLFLAASCGMISLLVSFVGGSARAQGLAVITALLLPVAFFEASNSKNDIVLSFFVLIPLLVGINIWTGQWKASMAPLLLAALAAGLAFATKGTAIAYLPASALLIIAACIRTGRARPLLLTLIPALFLSVLPFTPQLLRNMHVFHSPAGPNLHHSNLRHDPLSIASVALRNAVGQFACGSESWNLFLEQATRSLLTHVGRNADDPATTFEGQGFHLPYFAGLEDIVPSPIQTMLLILLPLGLLIPAFRRFRGILPFFAVTFLALFLFCFIFRWQPWQGRLLIPGYFMTAPLAGLLLDLLKPRWLPLAVTLLEFITLRPHLMFAGQRPLLGGSSIFHMSKDAQMSRMMPGRADEIDQLMKYLKDRHPHTIMIDGGSTEIYGLLRALHKTSPSTTIISGHATNPPACDFIIIPSVPYAGVIPSGQRPVTPQGFLPLWNRNYYWLFKPVLSD
jgi:hypothetical protein